MRNSALKNSFFNIVKRRKFICSVCGQSIKRFLPLDSFYAENAKKYGYKYFGQGETINLESYLCPVCGATDRERLYSLYIDKFVLNEKVADDTSPKLSLLHFAPDKALAQKITTDGFFQYRSADLLMEGVDDKIDITNLYIYKDSYFDCFICSHVLEHVTDDTKALRELFRIIKPGGWGILMVPIIPSLIHTHEDYTKTTEEERWQFFGQGDHVRLYAKDDFISLTERAGFVVEQFNVKKFGEKIFKTHGIALGSVLYIAKKACSNI